MNTSTPEEQSTSSSRELDAPDTPELLTEHTENTTGEPKTQSKKRGVREFFTSLIIIIAIVVPVRMFIVSPFIVSGASMDPTFATNDYLIVDKLSYRLHNPERGDVVIFRFPNDPHFFFIKRIIGLPGETVTIASGSVSITSEDGEKTFALTEPYITYPKYENLNETLGDDEYFVMGDNRYSSSDSRIWGPLPKSFISGKSFARLLPLNALEFTPGEYRYDNAQ
jgi:signal peptidase I